MLQVKHFFDNHKKQLYHTKDTSSPKMYFFLSLSLQVCFSLFLIFFYFLEIIDPWNVWLQLKFLMISNELYLKEKSRFLNDSKPQKFII